MKRCAVEIGNSCHANAPDAFTVLLGRDDNEHFAVDKTASCSAGFMMRHRSEAWRMASVREATGGGVMPGANRVQGGGIPIGHWNTTSTQ